jgi:hypothetical protein
LIAVDRQQQMGGEDMIHQRLPRRRVLQGGLGLAALAATPFGRSALAASDGDQVIAAAKSIGKTDLKAIMWSNYFAPMQKPMEEFQKATGPCHVNGRGPRVGEGESGFKLPRQHSSIARPLRL